ncbi:unnamed protein product [Allacma fusca]|uniref:Uncharacterized protein n=1 Tax=Allacma fusca TaxID=39272 RepID=A0A8J2L6S3_9HEXA|nr:unnamed protein product [Allacma fusca]
MTSRRICCCGAATWSRVIGWIQIIGCAFVLVDLIFVLASLTTYTVQEEHQIATLSPKSDLVELEEANNVESGLILSYIVVIVMILVYVAGIAFGALLLKGSYQRIPQYLRFWIIYAAAATVIALIAVVMNGVGGSSVSIAGMVISALFTILLNGFCIWVVQIHLREIEHGASMGYSTQA